MRVFAKEQWNDRVCYKELYSDPNAISTMSSSSTSQQPPPPPPVPLTAPSTTSANPSSSAKALWTYIEPALFHILRSPSNNPAKAPVLDVAYHVGIHTAVYNYFTAPDSNQPSSPLPPLSELAFDGDNGDEFRDVVREGLYAQLDDYFAEVAREILLGAAQDESTLIQYLVPAFTRFSSGARSVDRLLSYVNRCVNVIHFPSFKQFHRLHNITLIVSSK